MVDSSSNGSLATKDEAHKLFETMATTSAIWTSERAVQKRTPEVYEVDTYSALSAKIDSLFHKVESISQLANATYPRKPNCEECGVNHKTVECPILSQGMEQNRYQRQQEKIPQLEEMFPKFMEKTEKYMEANNPFIRKTETTLQNQGAAIKNLETQMEHIALFMIRRAPDTLPSNTKLNPREHVQATTTRSGTQLPERHVERSGVNNETTSYTEEEIVQQDEQTSESTPKESLETSRDKETIPINPYEPPIPFSQRLRKQNMEQQYKKFLEIFKKLHINIPLADTLL
ncbi:uncharacterized protein LOC111392685 [Olea europaea var. sylvestris]|uniref:uncharacterized protein LOC111392685 n=1 Tax=Olea europaea var. sylvestris TaxID=158386 RepID=UPI000C1D1A31|nr:uncharacterized protein LOC111392685 [Olea europaea var. sylvestris]